MPNNDAACCFGQFRKEKKKKKNSGLNGKFPPFRRLINSPRDLCLKQLLNLLILHVFLFCLSFSNCCNLLDIMENSQILKLFFRYMEDEKNGPTPCCGCCAICNNLCHFRFMFEAEGQSTPRLSISGLWILQQ